MNGVRKYVKNKKEEIQQRARGVNPTIGTELPRTRDKKTKQKKSILLLLQYKRQELYIKLTTL